jgi:hypothetical protein
MEDIVKVLTKKYSNSSNWSHGRIITVGELRMAVDEINRLRDFVRFVAEQDVQFKAIQILRPMKLVVGYHCYTDKGEDNGQL